jgi:hypothetical protein
MNHRNPLPCGRRQGCPHHHCSTVCSAQYAQRRQFACQPHAERIDASLELRLREFVQRGVERVLAREDLEGLAGDFGQGRARRSHVLLEIVYLTPAQRSA